MQQRRLIPVAALAVTLLLALTAPGSAQTVLKVRGQSHYVHGLNAAWLFSAYSTDLGQNPFHPTWGCAYNATTADAWMADLKRMRLNVVRVWLFEGLEGLTFDNNGYATGVQTTFLNNLNDLVSRANKYGLSLYLTFLNGADTDLPKQLGGTSTPFKLPNGVIVKNFINDSTARNSFINNVVWKIANTYKANAGVFGFDLINESNLGSDSGAYTWANMRTFAQAAAQKIHWENAAYQVSMSTQWWAFDNQTYHASRYGGLGLDFYDYHTYSDAPNLPARPSWLDKPLLLGEYGPGTNWSATNWHSVIDAFMSQANSRGYAGTLGWMYWHSAGNQESMVNTPGGNSDWKDPAWTLQWYGINWFGL